MNNKSSPKALSVLAVILSACMLVSCQAREEPLGIAEEYMTSTAIQGSSAVSGEITSSVSEETSNVISDDVTSSASEETSSTSSDNVTSSAFEETANASSDDAASSASEETSSISSDDTTSSTSDDTASSDLEETSGTVSDETLSSGSNETVESEPNEETQVKPTASALTKECLTTANGSSFQFWLYTPQNAAPDMPLIVYLHGSSCKGDDLDILMSQDGFPKYLADGEFDNVPAYVVIPQAQSEARGWIGLKDPLCELIHHCKKEYLINSDKVGLIGFSMGGTGAWKIALHCSGVFSCIVPMSGSVQLTDDNLEKMSDTPVWAFASLADTVVPPEASMKFIDELSKINSSAKITVLEDAEHIEVPEVFLNKEYDIIGWVLAQ